MPLEDIEKMTDYHENFYHDQMLSPLNFIYKVKKFKNHIFSVLLKLLQVIEKVENFPNKFNIDAFTTSNRSTSYVVTYFIPVSQCCFISIALVEHLRHREGIRAIGHNWKVPELELWPKQSEPQALKLNHFIIMSHHSVEVN